MEIENFRAADISRNKVRMPLALHRHSNGTTIVARTPVGCFANYDELSGNKIPPL